MSAENLLFPHEQLEEDAQDDTTIRERIAFDRAAIRIMLKEFFAQIRGKSNDAEANNFMNGNENGELHDKQVFGDTMDSLGYRTPKQCIFDPSEENAVETALEFFGAQKKVLCKPKNVFGGKGIIIFNEDEKDAFINFIKDQNEMYLVQEFLPPKKDFRYILHRDGQSNHRICYEKRRPEIVGDGKRKLWELIVRDKNIPMKAKIRAVKANGSKLFDIPEEGQTISLARSGNISQGAYGILPEDTQLKKIDEVLLRAIDDLQSHIGSNLSTCCFDIGISEEGEIIFYEFQMPFGFSGYMNTPELKGKKVKILRSLFKSLQKAWIKRNLRG